MKFGKHLEARQIEIPEHNGYFVDYKALKKLIKQLSVFTIESNSNIILGNGDSSINKPIDRFSLDYLIDDDSVIYKRLQENQASFFFRLERELEKVNSYYIEKELDLHIKFDILEKIYEEYKKRGKLNTKGSVSYRNLLGGIKKFQKDLTNLEQYVKLNRTGFMKALKKWDKRSHSQQKEFYFATVIAVQPIFTKHDVSQMNDAILTLLLNLDNIHNGSSDNDLGDIETINNKNIFDKDETMIPSSSTRRTSSKSEVTHNLQNYHITTNLHTSDSNDNFLTKIPPTNFIPSPISRSNNTLTTTSSSFQFESELETEIENWYKELLSIGKLKDETRKIVMLSTFLNSKIHSYIDNALLPLNSNKNMILKDSVTKLFILLVESDIPDKYLRVFYDTISENIDLSYYDEYDQVFSRRNVIHEAARCATQSRFFVVQVALEALANSKDILTKLVNAQDFHLKTPLHYASELGKTDLIKLLITSQLLSSVDVLDNDSHTPLTLAIIKNHVDTLKVLLVDGKADPSPQVNESSKPQFAPLSVACNYNNYEAAEILLEVGNIDVNSTMDHRGLGNLHLVAKIGGSAKLIQLLVQNGVDPNGIDDFNKWTPLLYAVREGREETVEELLNCGAKIDITDNDNRSPLFYAIWEGHIEVLNVLLKRKAMAKNSGTLSPTNKILASSNDMDDIDSLDEIPDFALPPPIMPLRKYGHNFLEKKVIFKIILKLGTDSIEINNGDDIVTLHPGRITLTSNSPGTFPRNIVLPIEEAEDCEIIFQVDSVDNFVIDFEVYPSFGTKLIAKTTAMSSIFNKRLVNGCGILTIPLFDNRLTYIGSFCFDYQVILPCHVKPLEITKYETYWKATSSENLLSNSIPQFVTSSSLSGTFFSLKVCTLNDGTIIAAPSIFLEFYSIQIFMNDISKKQLEELVGYNIDDMPQFLSASDLKPLLNSRIFSLEKLLTNISPSIQLDIQVCFPTQYEIDNIPVKMSSFVNLNTFIDDVLLIVFDHVRELRHSGKELRSIVFSSSNEQACSLLNWKQPNFAVIFILSLIFKQDDNIITDTANRLKDLAINPANLDLVKDKYQCIREMVRLSVNNNLLGMVVPYHLLQISSQLGNVIRSSGLLLIGSVDCGHNNDVMYDDNINGILVDSELKFNKYIDM